MTRTPGQNKKKDTVLRFRVSEQEADALKEIADEQTEGNLSMAIRAILRERLSGNRAA